MAPLNEVYNSSPAVVQPTSTNTIFEVIGGRNSSAYRSPNLQYGGEPVAPDDHALRELPHEYRYVALQALPQRSVGDIVGRGVFQYITNNFNCSRFIVYLHVQSWHYTC